MSTVETRGVTKRFGSTTALAGVDLVLPSGHLMAVLGPSGCGKTTLLRSVAGFERIDGGSIVLGDRTVAAPGVHLPPHRRQVAVVPQDGALFPHLTAEDNVAFGLGRGARRTGRAARDARVEECLELVGLGGLGGRMPHELSGGQQQRVAVARALAPRPPLVLLDEPFSALDASLRSGLRQDVRAALREDGATALLVTHDQAEALSVADHVAVMRDGVILQTGTSAEVYRRPVDTWVGRFVGDAVLLPLHLCGDGSGECALGRVHIAAGDLGRRSAGGEGPAAGNGSTVVLIRPEQVRPAAEGGGVAAVVREVTYHGHDALVGLDLPGGPGDRGEPGHPGGPGHPAGTNVLMRVPDGALADLTAGTVVRVEVTGTVRAFPG